jgi:hypothetical protein
MEVLYEGYPVFKGLQKPLEFFGIRGKFLIYAAASIGLGFVAFLIVAFLADKLFGLLALLVVTGAGVGFIFIKQKQGLHSKQTYKGIVVYKNLYTKEY